MENDMYELLRRKFNEEFNVNNICLDLMGLIDEIDMTYEVLDNYIANEFNDNFTYGELYDLFKDYLSKDKLKILLEYLGHDFVDLDELGKEEKEKYY
ncbi:MAG: hypothetical protein MSA56_06160 [Clostridium sp.]|nr:hypothetical protein [Clostridium sp.]